MKSPIRIVHVTTVHPRYDTRIFLKECKSLSEAGYDVHLVVADGKGDETLDGVTIHDIGSARGRFERISKLPWKAYRKIRGMRPDIVHFHDPELLFLGLALHWQKFDVIYDAHEDLPRAILSKNWIPAVYRKPIAGLSEFLENFGARRFSAVVAATPHIAERYAPLSRRSVAVRNYPLEAELTTFQRRDGEERTFCFIGAISSQRGIFEMVRACHMVGARLLLAGPFDREELLAEVKALEAWSCVEYFGVVSREKAREIMAESSAGLLFFHPEPNHVNALPNKMFEYMAGGLPVLCSDFAAWKEIVAATGTGLTCTPTDTDAIAQLMRELMDKPDEARLMGERGRAAVKSSFRWEVEQGRLAQLYQEILGES